MKGVHRFLQGRTDFFSVLKISKLHFNPRVVQSGTLKHAKLQSDHCHPNTITQIFLQVGCHSCGPTSSVKALQPSIKVNNEYQTWTEQWQSTVQARVNVRPIRRRRIPIMPGNPTDHRWSFFIAYENIRDASLAFALNNDKIENRHPLSSRIPSIEVLDIPKCKQSWTEVHEQIGPDVLPEATFGSYE